MHNRISGSIVNGFISTSIHPADTVSAFPGKAFEKAEICLLAVAIASQFLAASRKAGEQICIDRPTGILFTKLQP
jgi:hypothetical protein